MKNTGKLNVKKHQDQLNGSPGYLTQMKWPQWPYNSTKQMLTRVGLLKEDPARSPGWRWARLPSVSIFRLQLSSQLDLRWGFRLRSPCSALCRQVPGGQAKSSRKSILSVLLTPAEAGQQAGAWNSAKGSGKVSWEPSYETREDDTKLIGRSKLSVGTKLNWVHDGNNFIKPCSCTQRKGRSK